MLQVELKTFASDALEDAMRLAQTKALNSYSWSDMLNYLNYSWSDIYSRIAMIDSGFYSVTVRLNTEMTTIPPFVKNSIRIYAAKDPMGFNRDVFRSSGMNDMRASNTYHISGFDLFCPDAVRRTVWLSYVPSAPMLFFPRNNRDPKLYEEDPEIIQSEDYYMHTLEQDNEQFILVHKNPVLHSRVNITRLLIREDFDIVYISADYPYIFVTYLNRFTGRYESGFYRDVLRNIEFIHYNPFEFTGRDSNVEYLQTKWNDKTGLGVIVRDYNDYDTKEHRYRVKELGWTPDSLLVYPCPEMYRYLVARLADKLAALNESEIMGVSKELVEAKYAFEAFCEKDKSAWKRIDNVNGPTIGDWL